MINFTSLTGDSRVILDRREAYCKYFYHGTICDITIYYSCYYYMGGLMIALTNGYRQLIVIID